MARKTVAEKREIKRQKAQKLASKEKKAKRRTGVGVMLFCILLVCGIVGYRRIALEEQRLDYAQQKVELEQEKKQLEKEAEQIEEHKAYVQTKSYIEEVAREKLGLVYEDEIIFEAQD